jgi:hypothetical protein
MNQSDTPVPCRSAASFFSKALAEGAMKTFAFWRDQEARFRTRAVDLRRAEIPASTKASFSAIRRWSVPFSASVTTPSSLAKNA